MDIRTEVRVLDMDNPSPTWEDANLIKIVRDRPDDRVILFDAGYIGLDGCAITVRAVIERDDGTYIVVEDKACTQ